MVKFRSGTRLYLGISEEASFRNGCLSCYLEDITWRERKYKAVKSRGEPSCAGPIGSSRNTEDLCCISSHHSALSLPPPSPPRPYPPNSASIPVSESLLKGVTFHLGIWWGTPVISASRRR